MLRSHCSEHRRIFWAESRLDLTIYPCFGGDGDGDGDGDGGGREKRGKRGELRDENTYRVSSGRDMFCYKSILFFVLLIYSDLTTSNSYAWSEIQDILWYSFAFCECAQVLNFSVEQQTWEPIVIVISSMKGQWMHTNYVYIHIMT